MLYVISSTFIKNCADKRAKARPDHLARLEVLNQESRLIIAGPNPAIDSENPGDAGFSGSLIIAKFVDLSTAQNWAETDPYFKAEIYQTLTVKPFIKILPK